MIHHLKCAPAYYWDIVNRKKTFEIRYNDRAFAVGDSLKLREFDAPHLYTGNSITVKVTYIFADERFGLQKGFIIMGITH